MPEIRYFYWKLTSFFAYAHQPTGYINLKQKKSAQWLSYDKTWVLLKTKNAIWSNILKVNKRAKKLGVDKKKVKTSITQDGVTEVIWTPKIRLIYILHLIFKFGLECLFFYLSYLLQIQQSKRTGIAGFWVPEKYECTHGETEGEL